MACGVWLSILNSGWQQAEVGWSAATYKCRQRSIPFIPKTSDKWDIQVEASIKVKGQLYCYFLITQLLSEVVGSAHLETICSQKGNEQQEAMVYRG